MSIQSLRMGSLSSLSCMWMISYLLVVMLVYYWRQRCFMFLKFDMKDLGEALFVLGIEIHRDRRKKGIRTVIKGIHRKNLKEIQYAQM